MVGKRRFALCVVLGLMAVPTRAAPPLVGYQGRVLDAQGAPLNGSVALGFALFAAASGGSALWSETQPNVGVVDGVYSVNLGSLTPLDPSLLNGAERWLEVTVNGEVMTPRHRFTSAPYALRAGALDGPALPSLDALRGLPCNLGTPGEGTVTLSYAPNTAGTVTLGCTPSQSFTLTVQMLGTGNTAVVTGPGINCSTSAGADCSETYLAMTSVTLTPANFTGCTGRSWGGACTGAGATSPCTITMDAAKSVSYTANNCLL